MEISTYTLTLYTYCHQSSDFTKKGTTLYASSKQLTLCVHSCVCVCMQGINYLVENKLLDGGAQSIAEFLYKEEGLNKTAIGEFLGERWVQKVERADEEV